MKSTSSVTKLLMDSAATKLAKLMQAEKRGMRRVALGERNCGDCGARSATKADSRNRPLCSDCAGIHADCGNSVRLRRHGPLYVKPQAPRPVKRRRWEAIE